MPGAEHGVVVEELHRGLPTAEFTLTAGTMLSQLFDTVSAGTCNGIDTQTLVGIADRMLANPRYAAVPGYLQFHYRLLAGIARREDRLEEAIAHLEQAIAVQRSSELNMMMVTALGDSGEYDKARNYIEDAMRAAPRNPIRSLQWSRDLENLREYIDELERYSKLQE
jgi:tetratricopeptide (TPR) repeat protein